MSLFRRMLLLVCGVALPTCGQVPAKRPMTFADLAAMKRVSDPQVSPSGKWVLFSVTDVSLEKNSKTNHLWVVPLEAGDGNRGAGTRERQVTAGSGESNGRFSPDGKFVMYTATDAQGRSEIFVAPWDDATGSMGAGHAVTALETEADGAIWAPDSQHFLFVSNVYPECQSHAPMGPQRNTEEQNCNELKDVVAGKSPVQARIFDHLLYRHWNQYVGPKHSHIFYASVAGGANGQPQAPEDLTPASVVSDHEAPTFSLGGPLGYAISPDGKEVAYEVNLDKVPAESTNNDIFALELGSEPGTARKVSTSPGSDDGPQYSPDGKWLAWRSQARGGFESDKYDLVVVNRASGKLTDLTSKFQGWIDEFSWLPSTSAIVFVSSTEGEAPIYLLPFLPDTSNQVVRKRDDPGDFSDVYMLSNGQIVATRMGVNHPAELFATQPLVKVSNGFGGGEGYMLSHLNDALSNSLSLDQAESFWYEGADQARVEGFLIRPPNFDPGKKYPLKFLIHGGPQGAWGDAWSYRWNPELLAANGYVVVMVNPRGSTGYGQQFTDEVSGDWGGRAYQDLMKGLDYAEQHYPFIDKTRECALGASYGGYMANWVLTHTDRFKCIVTHDGMYNPQSAFGTTEELWFNEWEFRPVGSGAGSHADSSASLRKDNQRKKGNSSGQSRDEDLGSGAPSVAASSPRVGSGHQTVEQTKPSHPWDFYDKPADQDPFRKWSPMLAIKNAHTPTLVIHGQRDYRLDVSEGFQLFTALQLLGVPSRMLYFPDEGHWVLKPKNSELWHETVNDWCDRWTGTNAYAGVGPERNPAAMVGQGTESGNQGPGKTKAPRGQNAGVQTGGTNAKSDK